VTIKVGPRRDDRCRASRQRDTIRLPTNDTMVHGFALLLVFQLIGEVAVQALALPVPGPLVGMLLLFAGLLVRGGLPDALRDAANGLLRHLMLLFIPAVTGVMMYFDRISREWLPFMAACILGAAVTMVATALTLRWMLRVTGTPRDRE
jgi:holin-like protein